MDSRLTPPKHRIACPLPDAMGWDIPDSPELLLFSDRLEAAFARVVDRWRCYATPSRASNPREIKENEQSANRAEG